MKKLQRVLIMAGGTGGHVYPGIVVAKHMREHGIKVSWLGTAKGLESRLVPEAGIPIHFITISGLRGKGMISSLLAPFKIVMAILQAIFIILRTKPDVVLGFGGFVSGPGGIAAWLLRKKLIIHEQNARAGLTNQILSKVATKVLEGFPNTFSKRKKIITTGNPVRMEIMGSGNPQKRFKARSTPLRLLVVGGSLGAAPINQIVPRALAKMDVRERPAVCHQTGEVHYQATLHEYESAQVSAEITPYITNMAENYAWADVILCRAGASTIAELCAAGVGSILVPFPHAADDHQTANAKYMVSNGASLMLDQNQLTEEKLVELLREFTHSVDKRMSMAEAAYNLRQIDAAEKVLTICKEAFI